MDPLEIPWSIVCAAGPSDNKLKAGPLPFRQLVKVNAGIELLLPRHAPQAEVPADPAGTLHYPVGQPFEYASGLNGMSHGPRTVSTIRVTACRILCNTAMLVSVVLAS